MTGELEMGILRERVSKALDCGEGTWVPAVDELYALSRVFRSIDASSHKIEALEELAKEVGPLRRTEADLRIQLRDAEAAIGQAVIGQSSRVAELEADLDVARRAIADRKLGAWVRLSDRIVVNLDAYEAIVFEHKLAKLVTPASSVRILEEPGELEALRRACARMVSP